MYMTEQQETAYIQEYTGLMHSIAYHFETKHGKNYDCHDDLFQECSIVLLMHLRSVASEEEFRQYFPFRQMHHAMCVFILSLQTLSHPKRTARFNETIRKDGMRRDFRAIDEGLPKRFHDEREEIDDRITVTDFINDLPKDDRSLVLARQAGEKRIDIARHIGKDPSYVTRHLNSIGNKYISSVS